MLTNGRTDGGRPESIMLPPPIGGVRTKIEKSPVNESCYSHITVTVDMM